MTLPTLSPSDLLPAGAAPSPHDAGRARLAGRLYDPAIGGPRVVTVTATASGDPVAVDLGCVAPDVLTMSELLAREDCRQLLDAAAAAEPSAQLRWPLAELARQPQPTPDRPYLLAPIDLQVIKAAGVTFAGSLLERVIEERALGDPAGGAALRSELAAVLGDTIATVRPGSPEAATAKQALLERGWWSQYLEVGIGPDPEIFTKAPVLSAVGSGALVGVLRRSVWNNPEPEVVLAVRPDGRPVAATLGNDVNLRDVEGRSALLLGQAKDANASCAIGPFLRVFDDEFTLDTVRALELSLTVQGRDGFVLQGTSSMAAISRDVLELIGAAHGPHHQYPDGFVLFTGTLFAPTQDRDEPGGGFTHRPGDVVRISAPELGVLHNEVAACEDAPPWEFGIGALLRQLLRRNGVDAPGPAPADATHSTLGHHQAANGAAESPVTPSTIESTTVPRV